MEAAPRIVTALGLVKGLFLESPGARFSVTEAARSSGIPPDLCAAILQALEDVRLVRRDASGAYCRHRGFVDCES